MIKRIIFDFDDTLVPFRDYYYKQLFDFYNCYLPGTNKQEAFLGLMNYMESNIKYYTKEELIKTMEEYLNTKLPNDFWDTFVSLMINMVEQRDSDVKDILEYLSSKYELVILTNWIKEVQVGKLKKLGLYRYFKEVYACDTFLVKPSLESFEIAKGKYKYNECAMVGDSFKIDIEIPNKLGMKTYFITNEDIFIKNNICIKSLDELKELL